MRAVDALGIAGDSERAGILAEEAYSRFGGHPDPGTAAAVLTRAADFRMRSQPQAALDLLQEAIRLVSDGPPTALQAEAWYRYGHVFVETGVGGQEVSRTAFERAAEIAEAAGAAVLVPRSLVRLAEFAEIRGDTKEVLALLGRARELAEACGDGESLLRVAAEEGFQHFSFGRMEAELDAAMAGLRTARLLGLQDSLPAVTLTANACERACETADRPPRLVPWSIP